jgi:16S rRNA (uracil1498-N3)-methyltransferase
VVYDAAVQEVLTVPRLFVPRTAVASGRVKITGAELDHLRVLRLRARDAVLLFDDAGWEHEGLVESCSHAAAEVAIVRSYRPERDSPLSLFLGQCLGKGDKMDWVVEKAAELGARAIVPLVSMYTVPHLDERKIGKRHARWAKIALSATKQSGRTQTPEILPLMNFEDFVMRDWAGALKLLFWEGELSQGILGIKNDLPEAHSVVVCVGPEGGFAEKEVLEAQRCGFRTVHLGRRMLRTETAAMAALTVVQLLWGDMK